MKSETSRFFRIGDTVYTRKGGKKGKVVALRDPEQWPACIGVRFDGWENPCFFRPDGLDQGTRPLCVGDRVRAVHDIALVDSGAEGEVTQRRPDGRIVVAFDSGSMYWCRPHELEFVASAFAIGNRVWVKSTRCKGTVERIDPECTTAPYAVRLDGIGLGYYSADSLTEAPKVPAPTPKALSWEDVFVAGEPIPQGVFVCVAPAAPPAWAKPVLRALDHYDRHGDNAAAVFAEFAKLTPTQRDTIRK